MSCVSLLDHKGASFDSGHNGLVVTVARCQGDGPLGAVDGGLDAGRLAHVVDVLG